MFDMLGVIQMSLFLAGRGLIIMHFTIVARARDFIEHGNALEIDYKRQQPAASVLNEEKASKMEEKRKKNLCKFS